MTTAPESTTGEKALAAVKAEATATRLPDGSTLVPLVTDDKTVEITILTPAQWFEGAVEHLSAGRITEWVKLAAAGQDDIDRWNSLRKRYVHLDAFLTAWTTASGESPGESQGSSTS